MSYYYQIGGEGFVNFFGLLRKHEFYNIRNFENS